MTKLSRKVLTGSLLFGLTASALAGCQKAVPQQETQAVSATVKEEPVTVEDTKEQPHEEKEEVIDIYLYSSGSRSVTLDQQLLALADTIETVDISPAGRETQYYLAGINVSDQFQTISLCYSLMQDGGSTTGEEQQTGSVTEPGTEPAVDPVTDPAWPSVPEVEEPKAPVDPRTDVLYRYQNLGVVNVTNYLNIREMPTTDSAVVGILYADSGVDILETVCEGSWYHIVSAGIEGYVCADYVLTGDAARERAIEAAFPAVMVKAEVLNVRLKPSTDSMQVTQILAGSQYYLLDESEGDWLKISLSEEISGYVHKDFVDYGFYLKGANPYKEPEPEPEPEPEVVVPQINPVRTAIAATALQYVGGRYVWGGESLGNGVDCSGFMRCLFRLYGYELERCSYQQVNDGVRIGFEALQPGDLLFYYNPELGRIGHVAMYIGDGLICHAASANRGIVVDVWNYMTPCAAVNIIGW